MGGGENKQRLAAILAADAAGYSRLMAVDDQATVATLDAARAVFRSHIESNQGRVADMAGDSVLAVFDTAAGAVTAALGIQQTLHVSTNAVPENSRMPFRIGVHLGDVIEKIDGTIYGDGVNIASRLQALAEPGGVMVSDMVHGAVRDRITANYEDAGEHKFKNIARAVRAFRIDPNTGPDSAAIGRTHSRTTGATRLRMVCHGHGVSGHCCCWACRLVSTTETRYRTGGSGQIGTCASRQAFHRRAALRIFFRR